MKQNRLYLQNTRIK